MWESVLSEKFLIVGKYYRFKKYGVGKYNGIFTEDYVDVENNKKCKIRDMYQFFFPLSESFISFKKSSKVLFREVSSPEALRQALVLFEYADYKPRKLQWKTLSNQYEKTLASGSLGVLIGMAIDVQKRRDMASKKPNLVLPTGFQSYFEKVVDILSEEWSVAFSVSHKEATEKISKALQGNFLK